MKRREFLKTSTAVLATGLTAGVTRGEGQQTVRAAVNPANLRCEYAVDPLGIDSMQPRLSWMLTPANPEERGLKQQAYRVLAATSAARLRADEGDLWDTGKIDSAQSIQVSYGGKQLLSKQAVWWKVKVWDQAGRDSQWSSPASWSMGLLEQSDWTGKWIGVNGGEEMPEEFDGSEWISDGSAQQRALWFRRTIEIPEENPLSCGLMAALGSGDITVYVNGTKDQPPFDKLPHSCIVQDISGMFHPGRNVVAVKMEAVSSVTAFRAGITLDLADGEIRHIRTNGEWKVSAKEEANWEKPEFDEMAWKPATAGDGPSLPDFVKAGERTRLPARMLRREFQLTGSPVKATAHISGLGYYELYVNGSKAGDDVLAPALSDYDKRVFYKTHDVTELVKSGGNAVGILLGNGRFYSMRHYVPAPMRTFGYPKALLELEIEYENGERVTVATDGDWMATTQGPIRANNYYDGEEYDARMEQAGWASPGFKAETWSAAQIVEPPAGALCAQMSDPIRVMREVKPVKITERKPGVYVIDMGQNMVGWCRMRVSAKAGTRITLRHAETLRPNGELYCDNLRSARQTDVYIAKGVGEEVYEPRFISHGFRFVELRGCPTAPTLSTLTGRVANDSIAENADLTTSGDTINAVYRNMIWGCRGNYQSIPTDCSQRDERQGWLGDRSGESKGESFIYDVSRFYAQWVQHMEDSMGEDGQISDVAPAYWAFYNENIVWPSSFFQVTNMLYQQYGDEAVIRKHYPAMKRWMRHKDTFIKDDLMPLDTYGDWCVPPRLPTQILSDDPATKTAAEILGTNYYYYLLGLMSKFAVISGHPEDQQAFDESASKMKIAFNRKYFHAETGLYDNGTQTSSILPLAVGLAEEDQRKAIFDALIQKIETTAKGHVGTGLVGGQWLMQTLTENGRPDVACQIASQITYPSWGYMIQRGATTIWELWNGDTANPAMNSGNHLMLLGDFSTWLYENLAGIKSDPEHPGFKHIIVRPRVDSGLKFAKASHNSPYGKIATSWSCEGNAFTLHVSIPPNTTAEVYIPAHRADAVRENGKAAQASTGVRFLRATADAAVYVVGSGEYVFASTV